MKTIFKTVLLNMLAIYLVSALLAGLTYQGDLKTLFYAAVVLALANAFIKPFLKILLLPINIITLGLTGWIVNTVILFIVVYFVPGFDVVPFELTILDTTLVLSRFFSLIFISIVLSIITSIISKIID